MKRHEVSQTNELNSNSFLWTETHVIMQEYYCIQLSAPRILSKQWLL